MKTYIVQLDNHDDVISARDKISWSKANRVLLVWPRRGRVLERQVDLLLLQRHAMHQGAQLAVVTGDGAVRSNARGLGIPVFHRAEDAQQAAWRRDRRRRRIPRRKSAPPDARMLREERAALRAGPALTRAVRVAAFAAGLLALLALAVFFIPGARLELTAERKVQRLLIPVWASPDIPSANPSGGIPAQVLQVVVEGRDEAPVTGKVLVADAPATGEVQLTNLTDQPVTVPEGSVVLTLSTPAVRFATTRAARLPAGPGVQTSVPVEAVVPGSGGNVAAGRIRAMEGETGLLLLVENPTKTRGGTDHSRPAPSDQDFQSLRLKLLKALQETASRELSGGLAEDQRLLNETIAVEAVVEETREPGEKQPGDRLLLSMRVAFRALAVREADLQQVAQSALDANREEDYQPLAGSLKASIDGPVRLETASGDDNSAPTARGSLAVERTLRRSLESDSLMMALRGRSVAEASQILQDRAALETPPRIQVWPRWWPRLPFLPFRIEVVQP
jgi:hypothetical protein